MSHNDTQATTSGQLHDPDPTSHDVHEELAHPLPMTTLVGVFVLLLVLTFVTVAVTWVDLGQFNIWIALAIAVVKAAFVGLYFMHLRYDAPFNGLVLLISLLFVALFIGGAITDTRETSSNVEAAVPTEITTPAQ